VVHALGAEDPGGEHELLAHHHQSATDSATGAATLSRSHAATLPRSHAATLPRCHAGTLRVLPKFRIRRHRRAVSCACA
jgi:hypothetical protein